MEGEEGAGAGSCEDIISHYPTPQLRRHPQTILQTQTASFIMGDPTDGYHIDCKKLWERQRHRDQEQERAREREWEQARERQLRELRGRWRNQHFRDSDTRQKA